MKEKKDKIDVELSQLLKQQSYQENTNEWFTPRVLNKLPAKQDNSANYQLSIRKVEANANGTTVGFRYYSHKEYWFRIVKDSYLEANGKKYKVTAADGIKLDENNFTTVKATDATGDFVSNLSYSDFTLTFEPFDTIPDTFDFKEGDGERAFVIRNVSLK